MVSCSHLGMFPDDAPIIRVETIGSDEVKFFRGRYEQSWSPIRTEPRPEDWRKGIRSIEP